MDPNDIPQSSTTISRNDVVTFWGKVSKPTDTYGESRFPTVSKLTKYFLFFPHSNADVECIFSQVVLVKTKHRNKLKTSTLESILLAKQSIPSSCVEFSQANHCMTTSSCRCMIVTVLTLFHLSLILIKLNMLL